MVIYIATVSAIKVMFLHLSIDINKDTTKISICIIKIKSSVLTVTAVNCKKDTGKNISAQ